MAKSKMVQANQKIADKITGGFQKISNGVVEGYQKVEDTFVGGYQKIEDAFVDRYLTKDGESIEAAKTRLQRERQERQDFHAQHKPDSKAKQQK